MNKTQALGDKLRAKLKKAAHNDQQKALQDRENRRLGTLESITIQTREAFETITAKLEAATDERSPYIWLILARNYWKASFDEIKQLPAITELEKFCQDNKLPLELKYDFQKGSNNIEWPTDDEYVLAAKISVY